MPRSFLDLMNNAQTNQGGTVRLPDGELTLTDLASAQTLTNKTLTAPTVTSPVITGKPTVYSTVTTYTGATDAIDISLGDIFMLARAAGVDAATLADPAVADNGRVINIFSGTDFAHTITVAGGLGIGHSGESDDVITFGNRLSASITLKAHAGAWYVVGSNFVTIA